MRLLLQTALEKQAISLPRINAESFRAPQFRTPIRAPGRLGSSTTIHPPTLGARPLITATPRPTSPILPIATQPKFLPSTGFEDPKHVAAQQLLDNYGLHASPENEGLLKVQVLNNFDGQLQNRQGSIQQAIRDLNLKSLDTGHIVNPNIPDLLASPRIRELLSGGGIKNIQGTLENRIRKLAPTQTTALRTLQGELPQGMVDPSRVAGQDAMVRDRLRQLGIHDDTEHMSALS